MKWIYISSIVLLFACNTTKHEVNNREIPFSISIPANEHLISNIELSEIEIAKQETTLLIHTKAQLPPSSIYYVSLPLEGFLKKSCKKGGDEVTKGELLAIYEHPDYLRLRTQYLKAKHNYNFYKQNYMRQGELAIEQATSIKKMQLTEKEYKIAECEYKHLELQLKSIGVKPDHVTLNNLVSTAYLFAPVAGIIVQDYSKPGNYYNNENELFHISFSQNYVAELKIPEQYTHKLMFNDKLQYSTINREQKKSTGNIIQQLDDNTFHIAIGSKEVLPEENIKFEVPVYMMNYRVNKESIVQKKYIFIQKSSNKFERVDIEILNEVGNYIHIKCEHNLKDFQYITDGEKLLLSYDN